MNKVLVVDDIAINREILVEILKNQYHVIQASNGFEAIEVIMNNANDLSLILLDLMMPEMDGFEVMDVLHASDHLNKIPVIIITASSGDENEIKGLQSGAADFVGKPFNPEVVKRRVKAQVDLYRYRIHMEQLVETNVHKVMRVQETMVDFLASVIEYRDNDSGLHVKRTRLMADLLLEQVERSGRMLDELETFDRMLFSRAVSLHDVGKITTPDHILNKPGRLDHDEFEIIKQHTVMGAEIISRMDGLEEPDYIQYCHDICLYHHERWDGKGYPSGLNGKNIPFAARAMSVVDVYDALSSRRPYKEPFSHEQSIGIIMDGAGTQFDPVLAKIFYDNNMGFCRISGLS